MAYARSRKRFGSARSNRNGMLIALLIGIGSLGWLMNTDLTASSGGASKDPDLEVKTLRKNDETEKIPTAGKALVKVAVIPCQEMVDDGLYESIRRRTEQALAAGATVLVYKIDTFGGLVKSALSIWDYLMLDVSQRPGIRTVAYIPTKAISAGALMSVACQDIIMRKSTLLGDCAPIVMGGTLEGTEREKQESPLRSYFKAAAEANNYPPALCMAMVTINMEVYRVWNKKLEQFEYVETTDMPTDPNAYDLSKKKLVVKEDELLTVHAKEAKEYGLARAVVDDLEGALAFLEERDGIQFARPVSTYTTNWSEELVRFLTSPVVTGILFMIALIGIYAELNSPGLGLPGAIAVAALTVLFCSKFLIGLANWWEIGVFVIGLGLLLLEIFVIPGFGIAGISGTLMMIFALGAMMVGNQPDELPLPLTDFDWEVFETNLYALLIGFFGFLLCAYFFSKYLPRIPIANRLVLAGPNDRKRAAAGGESVSFEQPGPSAPPTVQPGEQGVSATPLRPAGQARFGKKRVDVVSQGNLIETRKPVEVVRVEGNRIVVKEIKS